MKVLLVSGTALCLFFTILSFSVACIWGGDEAVGLGHMAELVWTAVCRGDVEAVGEQLLSEDIPEEDAAARQDADNGEKKNCATSFSPRLRIGSPVRKS